ncbi:MAG: hypothetical protein AAF512_15490, partial [Pseudomonadota bacterium]
KKFNAGLLGLSMLVVFLIALLPLELVLIYSRYLLLFAENSNVGFTGYGQLIYWLSGSGLIAISLFAIYLPERLPRALPTILLIGQLGLTLIYLTIYPYNLLQPDGSLVRYQTTIWLVVLIAGFIIWGIADIVYRYRQHAATENYTSLLSPVAFFGLLVGLKFGATHLPSINSDDYHFGEQLLGGWSYLQGAIPYVDYTPPHGIMFDDLPSLIAFIFYDGTAASFGQSWQLGLTLLSFIAFLALYAFSHSISLALVATLFLGGLPGFLFLIPFLCLWLHPSLRAALTKWLVVWGLTAPIVILGIPPQGLLLVAAFGPMSAYYAWQWLNTPAERQWRVVVLPILILLMLAVFTPVAHMFIGAIRYVLENGAVNQLAYGIPWSVSWQPKFEAIYEITRMSWLVIPIVCLVIIHGTFRQAIHHRAFFPALTILVFIFLLIPYSMGRIDPAGLSRPNQVAIFSWTVLLPLVLWHAINTAAQIRLVLIITAIGAALNFTPLSLSGFIYNTFANVLKTETSDLKDGARANLPNLGQAYVENAHWDRLTRLSAILNNTLSPKAPYLDLTNRNAQYFYLDRKPVTSISAAYNMVLPSKQKQAVEQLTHNPPKIALLAGDNITFDGGGLALRTHYIYRFVIDNYMPVYEQGFIIGYHKSHLPPNTQQSVQVALKNIEDSDWKAGIHRHVAALMIDDPLILLILQPADHIMLANGEYRQIQRIGIDNKILWLDGAPLAPETAGYPNKVSIHIESTLITDYRTELFRRAFSQQTLLKIPTAWGDSADSLASKMRFVQDLEHPRLHQVKEEGGFYQAIDQDPYIIFDIAHMNISGREAGLLKFSFSCVNKTAEPQIQVFWWGDHHPAPNDIFSVKFIAGEGTMIVPLDASPHWLARKKLQGIRLDLNNPDACQQFSFRDLALFNRKF